MHSEFEKIYIGIDLTSHEYASLCDIADEHDISVCDLLSSFVADLVGSDERYSVSDIRYRLANDWLDHSFPDMPPF